MVVVNGWHRRLLHVKVDVGHIVRVSFQDLRFVVAIAQPVVAHHTRIQLGLNDQVAVEIGLVGLGQRSGFSGNELVRSLDFVAPRVDHVDVAHLVDRALFIHVHVQDALAFSIGLWNLDGIVGRQLAV